MHFSKFFDHKFVRILLFFCLPLLFLPKINMIAVDSQETAGLRIDDIVLFFLACFILGAQIISKNPLLKCEGWILFLTIFSLFSFLSNQYFVHLGSLYTSAKIFYVFRVLEYFLFFYLGAISTQFFEKGFIIRILFFWNLVIMILQKMNLAGGLSSIGGYSSNVSERVQGIASFPSEMGLILNLLFCYFVYEPTSFRFINSIPSSTIRYVLKHFYLYWMFLLFGALIIFTGNRISLAALLVTFFWRLKQSIHWRSLASYLPLLFILPMISVGLVFLIFSSTGIYERSADLFSWRNIELFSLVWDKIDISHEFKGDVGISTANYDLSWWIRLHKWLFAIKTFVLHPGTYLQGIGPGFAGPALDGGILRVLVEYGIIGTFIFWKLFSCLYRINDQTKAMVIAFGINMIFFDAFLAYKTMSILLFACGTLYVNQSQELHDVYTSTR